MRAPSLRPAGIRLALALAACLCHAAPARAAAFQLREGDADWIATAFAGNAAKAYDAGTAWNNPAGMTRLDGTQISTGFTYFDPGIRFTGQGVVGGVPVRGSGGGDAAPPAVTAGSALVVRLPWWNLRLGATLQAPFGLRTSYEPQWVGRYQSLVSAIEDIQLGVSLAGRVTDRLSIGGGPVISYFRARLTQAINTGAFVPGGGDTNTDIRGDDWAFGYHLGALYEVTDRFRIGVDYRSRIGHNLTGKQKAIAPPAVAANPLVGPLIAALNANVSAQVALPDTAQIGLYYDLTEDLALLGSASWTHWSLIQNLTVYNPGQTESTPINFRDTWAGSIGMNWRLPALPRLILQAGVLYDEGANTKRTRGPRLPDADRVGLSGGFRLAVTPNTELRAGYLHEFSGGGTTSVRYGNGFPAAGTLVGSYANNADVVTASISTRF